MTKKWGKDQRELLERLFDDGKIDPDLSKQGGLREQAEYCWNVTRHWFPDFVGSEKNGKGNAVRRLKIACRKRLNFEQTIGSRKDDDSEDLG